jgi:hypothetical protein
MPSSKPGKAVEGAQACLSVNVVAAKRLQGNGADGVGRVALVVDEVLLDIGPSSELVQQLIFGDGVAPGSEPSDLHGAMMARGQEEAAGDMET